MPHKMFSAAAAFAHRHNFDGTWDSICTKCFLTVASEWAEDGLLMHERHHNCDSLMKARHTRNTSSPEPLRAAGPMLEGRRTSAYVEAKDEPN
jgi:hypothetical protein